METKTEVAGTQPLLAQANLERIRGQWNDAIDTCVRVLRSHPGNADAHSLLGDIYRDQGELDDAVQWYRMAVDLRPKGPDLEKLQKLERERERLAAQSTILRPNAAAIGPETGSVGTTQLMGYSPKRWLNTLTIASACFLAAVVIVLAIMRQNPAGRGDTLARPLGLSSHPMMPTAETGAALPVANPNRPTVLPLGEQPRTPEKAHPTGGGLPPDQPNSARTAPLPTFSPQTPPQSRPGAYVAPVSAPSQELSPARVQLVQPLEPQVLRSGEGAAAAADRQDSQPGERVVERDPSAERDPAPAPDAAAPAPDNGAGELASGGGTAPSDR
jgi:hypothetical protein